MSRRRESWARPLAGPVAAEEVARRLSASGAAWFWLDGAEAAGGERRMSYLGAAAEVRIAEPGHEREFLEGLRGAEAEVDGAGGEDQGADPAAGADGFTGGWVVALGYEFGVGLLGLDPAPAEAPPAMALRADVVLAIDHDSGAVEFRRYVSPCPVDDRAAEGCEAAALPDWAADLLGEPDRPPKPTPEPGRPAHPERFSARWRSSDSAYASRVEACKRAIEAGDAYVLCLTDTAEARGDFDPVEVYAALRANGSAIRGGIISAGGRALVSASPERFLSVSARSVSTHPIKGTRPRGADAEADAALAAELAADPKERAENLMIVDLMRNDLSRVCIPGTVSVDGFLRVEMHPYVHQLVSTVSGRLLDGADAVDAITACFPGGSMTGAPKRRAIQILAALEAGPRGLYSGCFGWLDAGGDAELAMTIRGVELRDGIALVGAGGGITADSVAEREVSEKRLKAASILAAIRAARG